MTGAVLTTVVGGGIALILVALVVAVAVMSQRRSQHISMPSSEDTADDQD